MLHSSESFLNLVTPKVEWMVKEKAVFNVDTGRTETMRFLRLNRIDTYNYEMGNVDIADQLQLNGWISGCAIKNGGGLFYSGGLASFLLTLIFCTPKFVTKKKYRRRIVTPITSF